MKKLFLALTLFAASGVSFAGTFTVCTSPLRSVDTQQKDAERILSQVLNNQPWTCSNGKKGPLAHVVAAKSIIRVEPSVFEVDGRAYSLVIAAN